MQESEIQKIIDDEHMRLLSLFYYISGGMTIAFSCIFIFHFVFMLTFALNPEVFNANQEFNTSAKQNQENFFRVFTFVFGLFILAGMFFGGLTVYVGRCIKKRSHKILTTLIAAFNCLMIPYGTVLGIFTFIVLSRDSVRLSYLSNETSPAHLKNDIES